MQARQGTSCLGMHSFLLHILSISMLRIFSLSESKFIYATARYCKPSKQFVDLGGLTLSIYT